MQVEDMSVSVTFPPVLAESPGAAVGILHQALLFSSIHSPIWHTMHMLRAALAKHGIP